MDPQIHVFSINGTIEDLERRQKRRFFLREVPPGDEVPPGAKDEDPERELIIDLNKEADKIAAGIEGEIRKILPPASGISPQVEISFSAGSVLLSGTVLLLAWAGETAWGELRTQMAEVIKIAVRRVVQGAVTEVMPRLTATINVTPARGQSTPSRTQPVTSTSGEINRQVPLDWMRILPIGIAVLLFFILIMDRYFQPLQRSYPPVPPSVAALPPTTAPPPAPPSVAASPPTTAPTR